MSVIENLYRIAIERALKNKCPESIPRTGERARTVNCLLFYLKDEESNSLYYVEKLENNILSVKEYINLEFSRDTQIEMESLTNYDIEIKHFFCYHTITFTSISDYYFHYLTKWVYIKLHFQDAYNSFIQFMFNKTSLSVKNRMEILEFLKSEYIKNDDYYDGISLLELSKKLYTIRIYGRDDHSNILKELELNLNSLVNNKDLTFSNHKYIISPNALKTLDSFELEERKHKENIGIQTKMFWLTVVMAIFGLIELFKD